MISCKRIIRSLRNSVYLEIRIFNFAILLLKDVMNYFDKYPVVDPLRYFLLFLS